MYPPETIPDLLLVCLRHTPPDDLTARLTKISPTGWDQLIALAVEQQVASLLYHRLKAHGYEATIPDEAWQTLQKKYHGNALRNMRLYHELGKLLDALHEQNVPALVLKGAYLAATVYESIALRTMVDIDILVPQADLPVAIQQVQALGYQPLTPCLSLDAYLAYRHHLPPFIHANTVASIEVHWTIMSPNRAYTIPINELWAHSTPSTLAGVAARGFCPEDLLLHVCIHATYHHWLQQGVRFLCDIAEIVRCYERQLDWGAVVQRAVAWGWQRGVLLALYTAQQLLGAKIPEHVFHDLGFAERILFDPYELQALLFPAHRDLLNSPTGYFLNFLHNPRLSAKLRVFWTRLFLSRKEMAVAYAIAPHSPWVYLCYPLRLKNLLGRYVHKTWRMWRGDPAMIAVAGQQAKLQHWLEQG